jgi:environmental stress-induced protein Ves
VINKWSGGSTRELYIFPSESTYGNRDFEVRISSAKVEVEQSEFTALPGVNRKLMVLEGSLKINHENHHSLFLYPFDVDSFLGDWKTTSEGICTDFNVMTQGNLKSELTAITLASQTKQVLEIDNSWRSIYLYLHSGTVEMTISGKTMLVSQDELLVIEDWESELIALVPSADCQIVLTKIKSL